MRYLKVTSIHTSPTEPVLTYSEVDGEHREVRKVEMFWDGTIGCASELTQTGKTRLASELQPSTLDMETEAEAILSDISADEFEEIWRRARRAVRK